MQKWKDLYFDMLYTQKKWMSSHTIHKDSLVLILDLVNSFGFPSLGKIVEIENDKDGKPRIYIVEHKTKTQQRRSLRRTAHSLSLILEGEKLIELDEPIDDDEPNDFESAVEENLGQDTQQSQSSESPPEVVPEASENVNVPDVDLNDDEDDSGVDNIDLGNPDNPAPVADMILPEDPPIRVITPVDVPLIRDKRKTRKSKRQQ